MNEAEKNIYTDIIKETRKSNARIAICNTIIICLLIICMTITTIKFVNFLTNYEINSYCYEQDGNGINMINTDVGGDVINESEISN